MVEADIFGSMIMSYCFITRVRRGLTDKFLTFLLESAISAGSGQRAAGVCCGVYQKTGTTAHGRTFSFSVHSFDDETLCI